MPTEPLTVPDVPAITVTLLERELVTKTEFAVGSIATPFGSVPTAIVPRTVLDAPSTAVSVLDEESLALKSAT